MITSYPARFNYSSFSACTKSWVDRYENEKVDQRSTCRRRAVVVVVVIVVILVAAVYFILLSTTTTHLQVCQMRRTQFLLDFRQKVATNFLLSLYGEEIYRMYKHHHQQYREHASTFSRFAAIPTQWDKNHTEHSHQDRHVDSHRQYFFQYYRIERKLEINR